MLIIGSGGTICDGWSVAGAVLSLIIGSMATVVGGCVQMGVIRCAAAIGTAFYRESVGARSLSATTRGCDHSLSTLGMCVVCDGMSANVCILCMSLSKHCKRRLTGQREPKRIFLQEGKGPAAPLAYVNHA